MLTFLLWAQALGLYIGVPALFLYFQERLKNIARESSEKVLADYRHQHEQELAALNAEHQRRVEEFGLFMKKRHRVYSALYRRFRIASDTYGKLLGLTMSPDFSKYSMEDFDRYVERHKVVPPSMSQPIKNALAAGDKTEATRLLDKLHTRLQYHTAEREFVKAKNIEAAYELYLSDAVRAQLDIVRDKIAEMSVHLDPDDPPERRDFQKKTVMKAAVSKLFDIIRQELQRGEATATAAPQA